MQTTNLYTAETVISERDNGERVMLGEEGPQESFTDDRGELYRCVQRECGRCISKVYVDTDNGVRAVGWVFVARRPFEDDPSQSSLIETWVTVHDEHGAYA